MADIDLQVKAIDSLIRIRRSIENVQLYPPIDSMITDFFEMLYFHLMETLRQDDPSALAELEKKALSPESISDQQGDETIHISSLLDMIPALGVRNISFYKDSEKEELHILINFLAKNTKPVQDEVELPKIVLEKEAAPVPPANIEYLTLEKDQEIISAPDITAVPVSEDIAVAKTEKDQESVADPNIAEGSVSEGIAELEKVFIRINAMDGDAAALPSEEKMGVIKTISIEVAEWLEKEENCTLEYKELCRRLESILQDFISNGFFAEATPIINAFSKINNSTLNKNNEVREISLRILRNLASDSNFNILFKEINTNERNKQNDACQVFAGFGDIVMGKLLDGLKKATDSKARISILHIIEEMGAVAIPAIRASIDMNSPWYYLRNMAYLLGRVGNEKSVDMLKPLLLNKEKRVRKEALKSAVQTGGNMRGSLFLSILPQVDKELQINIIEILGKIKCAEAVTDLQFMLKSKATTMAKNDQISMQEEICKALGAIGTTDAISILSEVAESKSILGLGSYSKEVKYAAERALAYIKRR